MKVPVTWMSSLPLSAVAPTLIEAIARVPTSLRSLPEQILATLTASP
jgi:hypothetical protein